LHEKISSLWENVRHSGTPCVHNISIKMWICLLIVYIAYILLSRSFAECVQDLCKRVGSPRVGSNVVPREFRVSQSEKFWSLLLNSWHAVNQANPMQCLLPPSSPFCTSFSYLFRKWRSEGLPNLTFCTSESAKSDLATTLDKLTCALLKDEPIGLFRLLGTMLREK